MTLCWKRIDPLRAVDYDIVSYYGGDSKPMATNGGKQALYISLDTE